MTNAHVVTMDCIRVPLRTSVSEWASTHHFLQRTSAYFKYDKHPYMIEPSDAFSDIAGTWGVVLCVPSQTGKTTLMQNALGWVCEYDRQNTLIIMDTLENGQRFSRNRLKPFLRDTCGILNNSLEANPDKSNATNNISLGTGANVFIGTSKSPSQLASTPAK